MATCDRKRSPLARRPVASQQAVPRVQWQATPRALLGSLVRRYGLPSELSAAAGGRAAWTERDLEGLPLAAILLRDAAQEPLQMRAAAQRALLQPDALAPLNAAWPDVRLHTNGRALRVVGSNEYEALGALALAAAAAEQLIPAEQVLAWQLLPQWADAAFTHHGYRRTLLLLAYALSADADKSFDGFEQFQHEFDLNVPN